MKCTDKGRKKTYGQRRKRLIRRMRRLLVVLCLIAAAIFIKKYILVDKHLALDYEIEHYNTSYYRGETFSANLCVADGDISIENGPSTSALKSAGLFDVNEAETEFAYNIHEKLYPASTTKIMTALVAIKNADLSEIVTVGKNADSDNFAADEATVGIHEGDQITLNDLLYGLLLYSGNDTAVAIAEYVGGSVDAFADMMNEQAAQLMATKTHFVNPHGLFNEDHYTTAYDLYLIFNECIKYEDFVNIIQTSKYTAEITGTDGSKREIELEPTNYYAIGKTTLPEKATVIGGKTGTLIAAGNCLILLDETENGDWYISVVMGADTKEILYRDMTALINAIPEDNT